MAEFDANGFSAVSAFFGAQDETAETAPVQQPTSSVSSSSRNRQGVGSSAVSTKLKPATVEERILRVGKRKRADDQEDESLDNEADLVEEEEEEEGRTALAEKPKTTESTDLSPQTIAKQPRKKRKKKGKKEREAPDPPQGDDEAVSKEAAENNAEKEKDVTPKTKRKRRKVRSRQKNIYKDKRLAQHKPSHLIPGRPDYQGRPMTAETREKLKLPPSRSSRRHQQEEEEHGAPQNDDGAMKLAVDDLLDVGELQSGKMNDAAENVVADKPTKNKKKRRKRPKYKNLAY